MLYRVWEVALVAVLSCICGINYTIYKWFDYKSLGISRGALLTSLRVWGMVLLIIGILLLISLAVRKFTNVKIIDKQVELAVVVVFVLQLPIVSLWFMALLMQGADAVIGAVIHMVLLLLSMYYYLSSHRPPKRHKDIIDESIEMP
ncbi:hypothetical protein ACFP56_07610 [Paenibacillus septentrionalis]|uniref:Uncharacterized protein n=1 Tax=Paenibacillus septentrionalis TaxID=429342 RepID=A0ABW1V156_9BACL